MNLPHEFKIMRVRECLPEPTMIDTPDRAVEYWNANIPQADWFDPDKEAFVVLVLNTRKRILGHNLVALGSLDTVCVVPREVFRPIIVAAGAVALLAHNHPSGNPEPSEADIKVTRDLIRAGQLLKIEVIDHVIIGQATPERPQGWVSLRTLGFLLQLKPTEITALLTSTAVAPAQAVCARASSVPENKIIMNPTLEAPQAQETVTLYYRDGSSDKVYHASLEPAGDLFVVNFAYGRRGSTLNTGSKTTRPVDYEEGKRIYDKLVREKKAKGYTEGPSGTPYQHTDKAQRVTGILPQLLNPVDEPEVQRLMGNPFWCFQPKFDGKRLPIQKTGREVVGINRKGLIVGVPECLVHAALLIPSDFILDGEAVGLVYYTFDLLELNGENCRAMPLRLRIQELLNQVRPNTHPYVVPAQTAWTTADKQALVQSLREGNKEGVVMKEVDAAYAPGRPNSGGPALKHKFYATLSAVVMAINDKRSVNIGLLGTSGWETAGNVTVPPSHPLPKVGDVIDVRYLYAFLESGVVYQPVYLGLRADVYQSECRTTQLKFKSAEAEIES